MNFKMKTNEFWYGGYVHNGLDQPISEKDTIQIDLRENQSPNQAVPFFVSNQGRYIWGEEGFLIDFNQGNVQIEGEVLLKEGFETLKEAYLAAQKEHFPFKKIKLDNRLFTKPIYNSWIELTFHQNQKDILKYANDILNHDLPAGVLMIDDGWSDYYGKWTFNIEKFPNPKEMIRELKEKGFSIMLWLCPFITPDTFEYRETKAKDLLVKNPDGSIFITEWWNGFSAVLDFSNPRTENWLRAQLDDLLALGVDGFKFDAGDSWYYREDNVTYGNVTTNEHSQLWGKFGEDYAFNEYRVTFKAGGFSLLQRLSDKDHSWGTLGIESLIPNSLAQGITGHPFISPDMIGGGEYLNFYSVGEGKLDPELFNRHSEIASLMPGMQFSAAPWRILSEEHFEKIQKSVKLRERYEQDILEVVKHAKKTGEPILRYMEYEFPKQGLAKIIDQFMLGKNILVAPIYKKGEKSRAVYIPKGKWHYLDTKIISEGSYHKLIPLKGEPIVLEKIEIE